MEIRAVDSLVQRLIQQGANERRPVSRPETPSSQEKVDLSPEARKAAQDASSAKIEAKLLQLYDPRKT